MAALVKLAGIFLKIGVIFFGGGYVLIPLLHRIMVDQNAWLTQREFLDGLALSQLTPGPLAMLATFTGYRAGGFIGGLIATVCIFLPCTLLMLAIGRHYRKARSMAIIRQSLDGLLPAVVGLVAGAAWKLGSTSLRNPLDFVLLVAGIALLGFTRTPPVLAILGAGLLGLLLGV
jgi:chromate transporter